MKKSFVLFLFFITFLPVYSKDSSRDDFYITLSDFYESALEKQPCKWRDVRIEYKNYKCPVRIFIEQLEEDMDCLCYLLETAYAGYSDAVSRGLDLEKLKARAKEKFSTDEYDYNGITPVQFVDFLRNELEIKIRDTHFSIRAGDYYCWLCGHQNVFYSDIYVKKDDRGVYKVCKIFEDGSSVQSYTDKFTTYHDLLLFKHSVSPLPDFDPLQPAAPELLEHPFETIKIGSVYSGFPGNLFYYPVLGENVYRVGVMTAEHPDYLCAQFDSKEITLPVKTEVPIDRRQTLRLGEKSTAFSAYLSLSHFSSPGVDSNYRAGTDRQFSRFMDSGFYYQNKQNVILDLRSNPGGNSNIGLKFLASLYIPWNVTNYEGGYNRSFSVLEKHLMQYNENCISVFSPAVSQAFYCYCHEFEKDKKSISLYKKMMTQQKKNPQLLVTPLMHQTKYDRENKARFSNSPAFAGKLIIILDRHSCSASEETVKNAKLLFGDQVIIVGENSGGCITYGNVFNYALPNSNLIVSISAANLSSSYSNFSNWHGEGFGIYPDVWTTGEDLLKTLILLTGDNALEEKIQYIERALQ